MQFPGQAVNAGVRWRNELELQQAKRTDLAQQLEILNGRRAQLADQIARTEGSLRAAPVARLNELDARIAKVEQEASQTETRISDLMSNAPEHTAAPPTADVYVDVPPPPFTPFVEIPTGWNAKDVLELAVIEAAGFMVVTAILCRFAWLSAKRRFSGRVVVDNSQLQQSVDAIAIEVERISEGQRFVTTLLNQRHLDRDARSAIVPPAAPRMRTTTPV